MDDQSQPGPNGESITDIQNYLASFNKEIQDGSGSSSAAAEGSEGRTYYVAQTSENYQFADQNQPQYEGTAYFTPSEGTYYSAAQGEDGATHGEYQEIGTYPGRESGKAVAGQATFQGTVIDEGGTALNQDHQLVTNPEEHSGLQQIVLAVSEAAAPSQEVAEGEPREISVTIPASMTGHVHESTEQLLRAVGSQRDTRETSDAPEQPTFVAMQPGSSHEDTKEEVGQVSISECEISLDHNSEEFEASQVVAVQRNARNLAALLSQSEEIVQTSQHQTIRMVVRQPDGTETEQTIPVSSTNGSTLVTSDGQEIHVSDESTLQMMANLAEQAAAGVGEDGNNQVILNTGGSYQTVTIVPSDTNPGEVSYVLIVSQPDDKDSKGVNLDMSVYDFNEGEKHSEIVSEETAPDGTKMRTIKITPKKSQIVTQAHMCNYCNYTSPKRYLLSRHMKSHSEERPHKCSVCERGFKTLASLQNHVNTHTGTRPHQCKECEAAFTTSGELVRHVRYKHTHEKPHRCTECDYASVELSKLKRHMRCHTGERPYQCPHCTYASPDTYKLKRHLRIHTGEKPYECDVCHARFTQSNSLKAHKLIHSGNKPVFQCDLCPTTCGRKTDLRIHVQKLHTSDKPLKCKRCGKSFPDRYTYKVHVKTHEGEKCFKCDLCPYASISQRHLESHMLIHTDQKPYQCEECNQSFRQKQLLKRHRNLYHDPNYIPPIPKEKTHECPECSKAFRHKGNLIRHLAVHDPDATQAEKEEAMRIGQPKAPGEAHDGEEDDEDYLDEEDEEDEDDEDDLEHMTMVEGEDGLHQAVDGQQVVVFEVIQLPTDSGADNMAENAAAVAMAAANGETPEGVTIIQQVSDLSEDVAAAMAQVHGPPVDDLMSSSRTMNDDYSTVTVSMAHPQIAPRRRGRPRKYPLQTEAISLPINILQEREGEPVLVEVAHHPDHRSIRRRRHTESNDDMDDEEIITASPLKRGRSRSKSKGKSEEEIITDPAELARREEEMSRKRLEQKQKDMQECFGFNDDAEEDETILAMSSVPGVPRVVNINGPEGIVNGDEEPQSFS